MENNKMFWDDFEVGDTIGYDENWDGRLTGRMIEHVLTELSLSDIKKWEKKENLHNMRIIKKNKKPRVYRSKILEDVLSKITPEELESTSIEMNNMVYGDTDTNKEIRTWWLNQTEERRRNMVREYFKNGNSEGINTLHGIMPEEMVEMYNINVDVVIMDWEEILFDFIDFYPCQLPDELFEWLKENYEIPKKKDGKD
jgi:hypothetical protein